MLFRIREDFWPQPDPEKQTLRLLNKISSHLHGLLMLNSQHQCPAMIKRVFTFCLLVCTLAGAQTAALPDHWIAVRAGRVFTGTDKLATNQIILIKADRITEVGPSEKVKIPEGSEIVDLSHA